MKLFILPTVSFIHICARTQKRVRVKDGEKQRKKYEREREKNIKLVCAEIMAYKKLYIVLAISQSFKLNLFLIILNFFNMFYVINFSYLKREKVVTNVTV